MSLLNEVENNYAHMMNKIIFDKHLAANGTGLITGKLNLPKKPAVKPVKYLGMIEIPKCNFPKAFSKFCCKTLQIKDEVIVAQQEINHECNLVALKNLFYTETRKTVSFAEFN